MKKLIPLLAFVLVSFSLLAQQVSEQTRSAAPAENWSTQTFWIMIIAMLVTALALYFLMTKKRK